jgi:membrane protein required for colicin V production
VTWIDYTAIAAMLASIAWGIWRGLVHEVISVLGWVIAFLAANLFAGPLSETLPHDTIPSPELRLAVAFIAVFIGSLAVTTMMGLLLRKAVHAVGLASLDRTLGALFGVARGALIVLAATLLAGLSSLPREPAWRGSLFGEPLAQAALAFKPWLPRTFAERLRYD